MSIKIFGLEIGKPKRSQPVLVFDRENDGASEVVVNDSPHSGGLYFEGYDDILKNLTNESALITAYRELVLIPEVDQAVMEIVNDSIVYPKSEKYPVKLNMDEIEYSDDIKNKVHEAFEEILAKLKFNTEADDIFRKWYVDGRKAFYIQLKSPKEGKDTLKNYKGEIEKLVPLDVRSLRKVREIIKIREDGVEKIKDINTYFIYLPNLHMPRELKNMSVNSYNIEGERLEGIKFTEDSIVYLTSGLMDKDSNFIISHLHKAIKPGNMLSQIEDAMVIFRLSRATSRRAIYIDVENLPKTKAEQYMNNIMMKFKNKLSYDSTTGKVKNQYHHKSILEDYWLARRGGNKGTEITTLESGNSFAGIVEETEFLREKLYKALNVPIGRMNSESTFVFGQSGEITREEIKFSKFITNLRNQFAIGLFNKLLKTQLIIKRIITEDEWNEIVDDIFYSWEDDSHFAEMKSLEVLQKRLEVLAEIETHKSVYFSSEYIKKHILFQTDEEIEELEKQRAKEEAEAPEEPEEEPPKSDKEIYVKKDDTDEPN